MRYLLLIIDPEPTAEVEPAPEPDPDAEPCWLPWHNEMTARGVGLLHGGKVFEPSAATTVRVTDGEVLLSDGPFAETKELMLGFSVIDCANLDEAIHAASRHPATQWGGVVEVRPIMAE